MRNWKQPRGRGNERGRSPVRRGRFHRRARERTIKRQRKRKRRGTGEVVGVYLSVLSLGTCCSLKQTERRFTMWAEKG